MKLISMRHTVHGGEAFELLYPAGVYPALYTGVEKGGDVLVFSNGSGYTFLTECFRIAAELKQHEVLYIPCCREPEPERSDVDLKHDLVLMNYCAAQLSLKEIAQMRTHREYGKEKISRIPSEGPDQVDWWKVQRRLTVKHGKGMVLLSANGDCFYDFAQDSEILAEYGDDAGYNDNAPHRHLDWGQNTASSRGIILYYWHKDASAMKII